MKFGFSDMKGDPSEMGWLGGPTDSADSRRLRVDLMALGLGAFYWVVIFNGSDIVIYLQTLPVPLLGSALALTAFFIPQNNRVASASALVVSLVPLVLSIMLLAIVLEA